jgi:rod shape-determining protein MreD
MIVYGLGLPILMLAAVIDASVMVQLRYMNGQPSLLLLVVTSWALLNELPDALPWALIGGIFADLLSVTPLGASSLAMAVGVILVASFLGRATRKNWVLPPIAIVLTTVVYQGIIVMVLILFGWSVPLFGAGLRWVLPTLAFNLIGILFVFRAMGVVVEFFRPPTIR